MKQQSSQTYRELEAELQAILTRLEQGRYDDLDELLKDHAEGEKLLEALQQKLDNARLSIKKAQTKE